MDEKDTKVSVTEQLQKAVFRDMVTSDPRTPLGSGPLLYETDEYHFRVEVTKKRRMIRLVPDEED